MSSSSIRSRLPKKAPRDDRIRAAKLNNLEDPLPSNKVSTCMYYVQY